MLSNIIKGVTEQSNENLLKKLESPELFDAEPYKDTQRDYETHKATAWKRHSSQLAHVFGIAEAHLKPHNWRALYTREDVDLCFSKIKICDFNERIDVFGALTAQPHSSGYSLGSCNWTVESDCDSVCYLSRSSALNTHSKLFQQQFLKQQIVDCLLLTGL